MTTALAILGVAALAALFGRLMSGRRLGCGADGPCGTSGGCGGCRVRPGGEMESDHGQR